MLLIIETIKKITFLSVEVTYQMSFHMKHVIFISEEITIIIKYDNVIFESYLHSIHLESNLIFHPVKARGWPSCMIVAPRPDSEASHCKVTSLLSSKYLRTGSLVINCFT